MKLLLSVIGLFFCGSSSLFCIEKLPRVLHENGYMLLMEMRDKKVKDALDKIVRANHNYSARKIYATFEKELCVIASGDLQDFAKAAVPLSINMYDASSGNGHDQKLILGNDYGSWTAIFALCGGICGGIGLGYLLFKR